MRTISVVLAVSLAACVNKDKAASASDAGASPGSPTPPAVTVAEPTIHAAPGVPGATRAAVYTRLEKDGAGTCENPGTVLAFGDFQDEMKIATVAHGDRVEGQPLSIACKVAPNGQGWLVEAKIAVPNVGELALTSPVDGEGRSRAAKVALTRPSDGAWTSDRCELEPSMLKSGGVGKGRFAAAIKCPQVVNRTVRGAAPMVGTVFLQSCADH